MTLREGAIEIRPGVFYSFRPGVKGRLLQFACQDCSTTERQALDYMLRDSLWRVVAPYGGILCIPCLQRRLNRLTVPADFKPGFAPGLMLRRAEFIRVAQRDCTHQNTDGAANKCSCCLSITEMIDLDRKQAMLDPDVRTAQVLEAKISPDHP